MLKLLSLVCLLMLSACNNLDSQIEKCVQTIMEAHGSKWENKKELEANARVKCLTAASGGRGN